LYIECLHALLSVHVIQPCESCVSDMRISLPKVAIPPKGPATLLDIVYCTYHPTALPI